MKKLELTFEQVEILRDCLHTQIVEHYDMMHQTPVTATSAAIRKVIDKMEEIDELLKF